MSRAAVPSAREYTAIAKRAMVEVDVLAELLACTVRSHAPQLPAAKRLEAAIEQIPGRFAILMAPLVAARPPGGDRVRGRKTTRRAGTSAARVRLPAAVQRFDAAVAAAATRGARR